MALVVGMGVSGEAVARHLRDRGAAVVAIDDRPSAAARERARGIGLEIIEDPEPGLLAELISRAAVVVPSPGVPERHPAIQGALATGVPVRSEIELAYRWSRRPMVAVTGTNGKTTVTEWIVAILEASGRKAVAAGNIGLPLSDGVRRDVDIVVAEVSSFQLRFTDSFRPAVAVWLNLADDHLDWHGRAETYGQAKARIWAHQDSDDVAVVNADDPGVMAAAARAPARLVTFGSSPEADFRVEGDWLVGPDGPLMAVSDLPRALPHDRANALAAAAAALNAGGTAEGVAAGLGRVPAGPHRLSLVAEAGGVRWYDDSKATNTHAALAAMAAFPSIVLIAGGRNKGLDLGALRHGAQGTRAVVAIGEAAGEIAAAFAGVTPVRQAESMDEAVRLAAEAAQPGDAVVLAPGCASFDWYGSYAERGDDFIRAVRDLLGGDGD